MSFNQIIEGTINNILNKRNELYNERIKICKECPLVMQGMFGEECNPRLWLNPETNKISKKKIDGYVTGCGCLLRSKTRVESAKCPANKW